jgi:membrane-associated phospholipid phosphatase
LVVTGEAVVLAGVVTQIVKYTAGRMRPDAHALPAEQRPSTGVGNDAYVSFWSGHTSYAFSLASAAGTVAWLRHYRGYAWVWVAGFSVATATAYFRIASDKHYLTDALSAGAASSAIGFAVPFFLHHPLRVGVAVSPAVYPLPGGGILALNLF